MATHSSILTWRIPWTEDPRGLQSMRRKELNMTESLSSDILTLNINSDQNALSAFSKTSEFQKKEHLKMSR